MLDEPTAVLTPQEASELFAIVRGLTEQGKSIIFITHKLNEVLEIADRITVLRRGKLIETLPAAGATEESLATLMVGREVLAPRREGRRRRPASTLLEVEDLHVFDDRGIEKVRGVSLDVRAGEIVGLAGIDGNGQTELIDAMTGLRKAARGHASTVAGEDVTTASAHGHFEAGLGHIPEDRQRRGLVLEFSIAENIALHDYRRAPDSRFGWLFPRRLVERGARLIKEYDVRGGGPQTRAGGLSGGNQQKVVLAREIDRDPQVLIAAQPTRGLDVGAIEFVHRRLDRGARRGPRDPARLARARGDPLALRPHPRHLRGRDRRRVPARRDRGGARRRDDRRRPRRRRRHERPRSAAGRHARRIRRASAPRCGSRGSSATTSPQKAGGLLAPVLTALLAFLVGGLVVLVTTGKNPLTTYRAIFEGAGLQLVPPVGHGRRAAGCGAQPAADADHHDDAHPHGPRRRVRVPLRALQHRRPGPVHRRVRSSPSGSARSFEG